MKIAIIDYGSGNTQSVKFALQRLGFNGTLTKDTETIRKADKVIFPGVGEASSAMYELKKYGLDVLIPNLNQPVLGICLGMQLMCNYSEEGQTKGLGIFPLDILKFDPKLKTPKVGWNNISVLKSHLFLGLKEMSYTYFVHSYYAPLSDFTIAQAYYGLQYSAALKKDNFYACQFHPEKSSQAGEQILNNFLKLT